MQVEESNGLCVVMSGCPMSSLRTLLAWILLLEKHPNRGDAGEQKEAISKQEMLM
jgi:hypothetical protein